MKTRLYLTAVVVFATIFALGFSGCNNSKKVEDSDLDGFWVLKTFNGKDARTIFEGALPTLIFNFDNMTISGTGGCNRYGGDFTFKDNILSAPNIVSTQMLCFENNEEQAYFIELAKNNTLSIVNGLLTVTNRDKIIVMEFEKGNAPADADGSLEARDLNGEWTLSKIEGTDAAYFFGDEGMFPSLTFDSSEMRVTGNAGCNSFNTTFKLDGHSLSVGEILTTRMTCPNIDGENRFIRVLSDALEVSMPNADILMLVKGDEAVLEFERN